MNASKHCRSETLCPCGLHVARFGSLCAWCWDAYVYRRTGQHSGEAQEIMREAEEPVVQLGLFS